jgi:hypothetical protein
VSDISGNTIEEGKNAEVRITFNEARRGVRELDVTDAEAEAYGGRPALGEVAGPKPSAS